MNLYFAEPTKIRKSPGSQRMAFTHNHFLFSIFIDTAGKNEECNKNSLFVPKGLNRIQACGLLCRKIAEDNTDGGGKDKGRGHDARLKNKRYI